MRVTGAARARLRRRARDLVRDDAGSSPVEFVLVGTLLTAVTLAVLQLGIAVYVRNVVHDAAVEGAYYAALADTTRADGAARTALIIDRTVGEGFVDEVTVAETARAEGTWIEVTVVARLPLVGLLGPSAGWEVTAHAPAEATR